MKIIITFISLCLLVVPFSGCQKTEQINENELTPQTNLESKLYFEENQGQTNPDVKFIQKSSSSVNFFTPKEVVYKMKMDETKGIVLRQSFKDANKDPNIAGKDLLKGKVNYLKGNDSSKWQKGVNTYSSISYKDLYPGIDLNFFMKNKELLYEYEITNNDSLDNLQIELEGNTDLSIDQSGNLIIQTELGNIVIKKPSAKQEDSAITVNYKIIDNHSYTFNTSGLLSDKSFKIYQE